MNKLLLRCRGGSLWLVQRLICRQTKICSVCRQWRSDFWKAAEAGVKKAQASFQATNLSSNS